MTNNSSSTMEVPQAKDAMDKFKMEVASEIGVNLKQGYNGDLTSAQAGSIGGEMVRRMIKRQEEQMANGGISCHSQSAAPGGICRLQLMTEANAGKADPEGSAFSVS